jgi:hypothetical protein
MNGAWITDAELKDILLALAKSGAPKPKKGTTLGDALARFTTPPGSGRTVSGEVGRTATTCAKQFAVFVKVTKTQEFVVLVDAVSLEEAASLAEEFGSQVEINDSGIRHMRTSSGTKEFRVGCDGSVDVDVTITDAEQVDPDAEQCGCVDEDNND